MYSGIGEIDGMERWNIRLRYVAPERKVEPVRECSKGNEHDFCRRNYNSDGNVRGKVYGRIDLVV